MKLAAKVGIGLSAAVVAGLVAFAVAPAIAASSEQPAAPIAVPTSTAKPDAAPAADTATDPAGPGECTSNASISTPYHDPTTTDPVKLSGKLTDMGESDVAAGTVGLNAEGLIETYTVAPGDSLIGIGERFCIDYVTVAVYNHVWPPSPTIQPGDTLVLRPDPTAPWSHDGD